VLPCAAQVRVPFVARCGVLLLVVLLGVRDKFCIAEGGLLLANWRCRADIASLFGVVVERPTLAGAFEEEARWFIAPFCG